MGGRIHEDFKAIPDDESDAYIDQNSEFDSWEDTLEAAGSEWIAREIGLDDF